MTRLLAVLAAVGLLAGCTSTKAAVSRAEFAWESERQLQDNLEAQRSISKHYLELVSRAELDRLNKQLEAANNLAVRVASTNPGRALEMMSEATHRYYAVMDQTRRSITAEHGKVDSLFEEGRAIGKGFRTLTAMADLELTVPTETAKIVAVESIKAADELWRQYQAANPPKPVDGDGVNPPAPPETGYNGGGGNTVYYEDGLDVE